MNISKIGSNISENTVNKIGEKVGTNANSADKIGMSAVQDVYKNALPLVKQKDITSCDSVELGSKPKNTVKQALHTAKENFLTAADELLDSAATKLWEFFQK